jgi:uncharacterized protein involved in exopolysaccharide biosynthesis
MTPLDSTVECSTAQSRNGAGGCQEQELLLHRSAEHCGWNWISNATILWEHRHLLFRVAILSLLIALAIAFLIPKRYKSSGSIMPPTNSSGSEMLAALTGHALGGVNGLGGLATAILGGNNTTALFATLLHSGTVADHLITRFDLQRAYHKHYRSDTAKYLARHTDIVEDKKSGVITVTVYDTDPRRARDLAKGYLDELNLLVNRTSTSSAHQERLFIERRLQQVSSDLEHAQQRMSDFSSTHATVDIREQARALVDAAARVQAQLIVERSGLDSLRQIYGDGNVRVRAAQARIAVLEHQLGKMGGSAAPLPADSRDEAEVSAPELSPPLRQLPRLAVPYADLYREVQVQQTIFELLTQQDELARIQEAKDVPVVSIIDTPGIPEKKYFPPRLLLSLLLMFVSLAAASAHVILQHHWSQVAADDPRKLLVADIAAVLGARQWRLRALISRRQ